VPPTGLVRPCFREPFGEGSRRTPGALTPVARVLDALMRRTLLPRGGYREGLTRFQLWLIHHLISQTPFDIWDLMLCEMEDTLAEGFKGHRQLPYAHWITFLLRKACPTLVPITEALRTVTEFLDYDMRQLMVSLGTPSPLRRQRDRPKVTETAAQQDATVGEIADDELAALETQ